MCCIHLYLVERRRKDKINNWILKLADVVPQCSWGKQVQNLVFHNFILLKITFMQLNVIKAKLNPSNCWIDVSLLDVGWSVDFAGSHEFAALLLWSCHFACVA